ncbi:uncharacterized protein DEA37_0010378 [Paragonimus westermani]|uniref:RH2 domain-containing protein n=1 Tax=Paragonimus westermani TaxID=34504 RepID=A0A5J4NVV8_9TREM|nr:uncharacterized protein DEA37_0010378 [Paragonimus westermani]
MLWFRTILLSRLADPSFDEFSQGDFLSEDGHDVKSFDGSCCTPQANPGDTASSDMFSGVTKEINNLIKENQDLVQTKNALNVVTNDLIGRIDDLTCENVRLSSERSVLITNGTGMLVRIKDLERECRRLRQELDSTDLRDSVYSDSLPSDNSANEDEGSPEPLAMRKRFSRVEMARVLLERNYYKEQLIELQDTIRWTEMLRVEQRNRTGSRAFKKSGALWNCHTTNHARNTDRPQRNLTSGRLLRLARQNEWITLRKSSDPEFKAALRISAPYTCYVRPLSENMPGLRIWCATRTYTDRTICAPHTSESSWTHTNHPNSNGYFSSKVWICSVSGKPFNFARSEQPRNSTSDPNHSTVHSLITIIDADEPTQNLDSFTIPSATVLCMTSIPGDTSDTHSHLKQTESHWQAIPLDLSEELMPFQRRATFPVPGVSFPLLSRSACVSTSSVSVSITHHRHPSMMEMGSSLYSGTGSISRTSASNPDGAFSYFVERRKFLVHSGISEPERFRSATSGRPDSALEQPVSGHTVTSSELPSSSTCPSAPNSVTDSTAFQTRPSSAQPTVWIGCYDGTVFVHSSVTKWRHCLHALHLPDSITQIRHHKGRAFVSLANGQLVVFRRRLHCPQFSSSESTQSVKGTLVSSSNLPDSGSRNMSPTSFTSGIQGAVTVTHSTCSSNEGGSFACVWDFTEACVIIYDLVRSTARQLIVIPSGDTIWTSCRKRITVIDAVTLQLINSFEVQSERDATIRHMTVSDNGVWVGLRNEPTLFLYNASSYTHLQTVVLEPLISSRSGKLWPTKHDGLGLF